MYCALILFNSLHIVHNYRSLNILVQLMMQWCFRLVSQFGHGLLILCLIISSPPSRVSSLTTNDFFSFGLANGDAQLSDGDDVVASLNFLAPFFFYGQTYTSYGVSAKLPSNVYDYLDLSSDRQTS